MKIREKSCERDEVGWRYLISLQYSIKQLNGENILSKPNDGKGWGVKFATNSRENFKILESNLQLHLTEVLGTEWN